MTKISSAASGSRDGHRNLRLAAEVDPRSRAKHQSGLFLRVLRTYQSITAGEESHLLTAIEVILPKRRTPKGLAATVGSRNLTINSKPTPQIACLFDSRRQTNIVSSDTKTGRSVAASDAGRRRALLCSG